MANYITESLEEGEQIVLSGRLHWSATFSYLLTSIVLVIAGVAMGVYGATIEDGTLYYCVCALCLLLAVGLFITGELIRSKTEFAVTTNRFIQKDGIINIKMTEIPLFKVETVNFYQTFWQRLLGTGCLEMVGSGGTSHKVHAIEHPMEIRKTVVAAINRKAKEGEE